MWLRPRVTVRQILEAEVRPSWVPVVALAAVCAALNNVQFDPEAGGVSMSRSAMPIVMGSARIVFGVLIGPFILAVVGGWLGGEGDPADIRQSVAWSYVPFGAAAALWVVVLLASGVQAFNPAHTPQSALEWVASIVMVAVFVCYVWSIPLLVASLAEVMRFSIFKSILTILIPLVPLWLLEAIT
jgi:hypothetical protein